jgi:hypothetical protein
VRLSRYPENINHDNHSRTAAVTTSNVLGYLNIGTSSGGTSHEDMVVLTYYAQKLEQVVEYVFGIFA